MPDQRVGKMRPPLWRKQGGNVRLNLLGIFYFRQAQPIRQPRDMRLDRLLIQPFLGPASGYPINRRGRDADST